MSELPIAARTETAPLDVEERNRALRELSPQDRHWTLVALLVIWPALVLVRSFIYGIGELEMTFGVIAIAFTSYTLSPIRLAFAAVPGLARSSLQELPPDLPILREALARAQYAVVAIDAMRMPDAAGLAAELDRVLGPFEFPTDPTAKIAAHIRHERRSNGHRAILLIGADAETRRTHPHLTAFVADWARIMRRNHMQRLLFVADPLAL